MTAGLIVDVNEVELKERSVSQLSESKPLAPNFGHPWIILIDLEPSS